MSPAAPADAAPDHGPTLVPADEPSEPPEPTQAPATPPAAQPADAPRFVPRDRMLRGHVPLPSPEPWLTEREARVAGGLLALATGFVLTGSGGLIGLWLYFGEQMFAGR